jgi:hypothetical protein
LTWRPLREVHGDVGHTCHPLVQHTFVLLLEGPAAADQALTARDTAPARSGFSAPESGLQPLIEYVRVDDISPSLTSQSVMSKTRAHHFHGVDDAMKGLPVSYRSQPGRTNCGSQEAPVTTFGFATRSVAPQPCISEELSMASPSGHLQGLPGAEVALRIAEHVLGPNLTPLDVVS